ncbi:hypothetical protein ABZ404_28450 [Streptomyces sp. NPDC005878]
MAPTGRPSTAVEMEHHAARIDTLLLIADALDVPLSDLVRP